jgi:hypothetical protein
MYLIKIFKSRFQQKPPKLESGGSTDRPETIFFGFPIQKYLVNCHSRRTLPGEYFEVERETTSKMAKNYQKVFFPK